MAELKSVIAKNISELRTSRGMTQLDLAEKLHYSDKAVSKWERGESVPEIATLVAIAELFGVTLDYLVCETHEVIVTEENNEKLSAEKKRKLKNRAIISAMSILIVWFVAMLVYVLIDVASHASIHWVTFLYAVPVSMLLWLIFNSVWFNRRRNYLIISLFVWTLLAAVHITVFACGHNLWQFYLLGIPGQIVIILWSRLRLGKNSQ